MANIMNKRMNEKISRRLNKKGVPLQETEIAEMGHCSKYFSTVPFETAFFPRLGRDFFYLPCSLSFPFSFPVVPLAVTAREEVNAGKKVPSFCSLELFFRD